MALGAAASFHRLRHPLMKTAGKPLSNSIGVDPGTLVDSGSTTPA